MKNKGFNVITFTGLRHRQVIDEIKVKSKQPLHRAVYDIFHLLNNNKEAFSGKIGQDDLRVILKDLENLSEASPRSSNDSLFVRESEQVINRLMFFLDRLF